MVKGYGLREIGTHQPMPLWFWSESDRRCYRIEHAFLYTGRVEDGRLTFLPAVESSTDDEHR